MNVTAGLIWGTAPNLATAYTMAYMLNIQADDWQRTATLELWLCGSSAKLGKLEAADEMALDAPIELATVHAITRFPLSADSPDCIQYLSGDGVGN